MAEFKDSNTEFRALSPEDLLKTQEPAIRIILRGIAKYTLKSNQNARASGVDGAERQIAEITDRPHQVYLIDGSRGAGKTYTLLSVELAVKHLVEQCNKTAEISQAWRHTFEKWIGTDLVELGRIAGRRPQLIHTLRIIFPGDMEDGDAVMEAIFAAMTASTEARANDYRKTGNLVAEKAGQKLNDRLRREVAQGWYFARRFGYDAIVRDSTDYDDLVKLFESESRKAAGRIDAWRAFLSEYLEFHNAASLVVLLDDPDVRPELTSNILHALRMYLDHPKVITVLAGNLKAMRTSLLRLRMSALSSAVTALNHEKHPTADDWGRDERKEIEDYLEKVLPPEHRVRIKRPEVTLASEFDAENRKNDFTKIVGLPLPKAIVRILHKHRRPFLDAKFRLAIERELGRSDAPSPRENRSIEYFLSWWLFANRYRDALQPRTVRQLKTWKSFVQEEVAPHKVLSASAPQGDRRRASDATNEAATKRLPVLLFDNPANFALIQRMGDDNDRLLEWLRLQKLEASWVGRRRFRLNESDIEEGTFTYDYLRYRLDLGIGMPIRDNADEIISDQMLPALVGRSFMRRFFQPRQMPRRHRRLGLVKWLNHASIPANCVYFSDLSRLPDISFVSGLHNEHSSKLETAKLLPGKWEAELCDKWMELIEDRQEQEEDEYLLRYLREIVFEGLRGTAGIESDALAMALDPPDAFEKRRYAVYEHFLEDEWDLFGVEAIDRKTRFRTASMHLKELSQSDSTPKRHSQPPSDAGDRRDDIRLPRMLALYSALTNDMRRAWHAIRIHQASPTLVDGSDGDARQPFEHTAFAAIANRDLMPLPTLAKLKALLHASDWTRGLMTVFSPDNVSNVLKKTKNESDPKLADIMNIFAPSLEGEGDIVNQDLPQGVEEKDDFRLWTTTLRQFCRRACFGWPVHDGKSIGKSFEDELFNIQFEGKPAKRFKLKIFEKTPKEENSIGESEIIERQKQKVTNGQAGRRLVWLLLGLAPSLPAIIHANTMSLVYQAELEGRAKRLYLDALKNASKRERTLQNELQKKVNKFYDDADAVTKEWSKLVGTLAIIVRYIKIKCLQLDVALFLQRLLDADQGPGAERVGKTSEENVVNENIGRFLAKCKYDLGNRSFAEAGQACLSVLTKIRSEFSEPESMLSLAKGLAIHPDASPSTLFGDDWMQDLFTRRSIVDAFRRTGIEPTEVDPEDNPLSVSGIFGEVEQWLWATSRSLRKLRHKIASHRSTASKGADRGNAEAIKAVKKTNKRAGSKQRRGVG